MRSFLIPAAFAAFAIANPTPQELDWDAIDALDPVPTASIPIVDAAAQATTISYSAALAASTISANIAASGISTADSSDSTSTSDKRGLIKRTDYTVNDPDTDIAFSAYAPFADAANNADVPSGYTQTFTNLNASNNAFGYMGYTVLDSYDTDLCASKCNAIDGCASFNLC